MQFIYEHFLRPSDLRGSAVSASVAGVVFLLLGIVAALLFLYDGFVAHVALRDWFSGWDWLFLLGLPAGPLLLLLSVRNSRRARSLARIEAGGIPAWGRVTKVRQAGETHGDRQVFTLLLEVRAADGSVFDATAIDYLPISHAQLYAWTELYERWFPVRLDPQDRTSAKILWHGETPGPA